MNENQFLKKNSKLIRYTQIPSCLLKSNLNSTTLIIYSVLLGRAMLSLKNGWTDEFGNVFIRYKNSSLAQDVVNRRWESGKPMIVTTNLTLDEVKEIQDDNMMKRRIYDRVLDMCKPILVYGKSKREESGKQKMKLLKEIFSNVSKDEGGEADE